MDADRKRSKLQEDLVSLYLRLNGFFVTGFIVHSPVYGRNATELDALALRLPFNSEPERQIGPDKLLDLSCRRTDLAICEVKSKGLSLQFNRALYADPGAATSLLRWSGLFEESEVHSMAAALSKALTPQNIAAPKAPMVSGPRGVRIRGLLFGPEHGPRKRNQPWFISGAELFQYVWRCLCPETPRVSCSTTYDLQAWRDHEPIVEYFKSRDADGAGNMDKLYAFIDKVGF